MNIPACLYDEIVLHGWRKGWSEGFTEGKNNGRTEVYGVFRDFMKSRKYIHELFEALALKLLNQNIDE